MIPLESVPTLILACLVTGFMSYWFGYWMCFFENGSDENEEVWIAAATKLIAFVILLKSNCQMDVPPA
jgi:hypothetical protein